MKTKLKSQKGFTIIEVLIVLAIAGLILLIVFLAVPALQRNSRNTQYKNGAASILAAANESINNNNGSMPTAVAIGATDGAINVTNGGVATAYGKTQASYSASVGTTAPVATSTGVFVVATNRKCNAAQNGLDAATTNRSIAILYNLETGGANTTKCTES